MIEPEYVLGLDIGGTKLAAGVCKRDGTLVSSARVPTLSHLGPDAVIDRIVELCHRVMTESKIPDIPFVGVGCVGPLDVKRGVVQNPPNLPGWIDIPLRERLEKALQKPIFVDNDANAAALGEHRFGAGRGIANLVYLTLSTGVGGGLIVNHELWEGANGNAGEIGHSTVAFDGRLCRCGSHGCLEAYVSGTHIASRARERIASGAPSQLPEMAGGLENISAATVLSGVQAKDAVAMEIWNETLLILAAGLANVVNIFNPEQIILGGGVIHARDLLFTPLRQLVAARALPPLMQVVQIVPAELGDNAGVLGAAAVGWCRWKREKRKAQEPV
jgi:glucokinase